jgi:hypothetical protein
MKTEFGALEDAMQPPFNFSDLFIYSHGWWTNGNNAMAEYGQYTIEFTKTFLSARGYKPAERFIRNWDPLAIDAE